jgi:hypothetical protein
MHFFMRWINNSWFVALCVGLALMFVVGLGQAKEYGKWNLLQQPQGSDEYLAYNIAYSGLLTGFVWKNLADMAIYVRPKEGDVNHHPVCQSVMRLSTENHSFAETFHPVRYEWIANNSPDLAFTRMVEIIDSGKSGNHHVLWMDWPDQKIKVYRKRELKPVEEQQLSFLGEQWFEAPKLVWEKDGKEAVPSFLLNYPAVDDGKRSYLIHDKTVNDIGDKTALDPLGALVVLRGHDFVKDGDLDLNITVNDEVKPYTAQYQDKQTLKIGKTILPAIRLRITSKNEEGKTEGWMDVWLSDDAQHLPVQFQLDAPVGKMRVQISEASLKYNQKLGKGPACYDHAGKKKKATAGK